MKARTYRFNIEQAVADEFLATIPKAERSDEIAAAFAAFIAQSGGDAATEDSTHKAVIEWHIHRPRRRFQTATVSARLPADLIDRWRDLCRRHVARGPWRSPVAVAATAALWLHLRERRGVLGFVGPEPWTAAQAAGGTTP